MPKGAIAVVDDARCSVVDKQNSAVARGAAALIVVSTPNGQGAPPTLFSPGYFKQLTVPVAVAGASAAGALAGATATDTSGAGRPEHHDHIAKRVGANQDRLAA